MKSFVLILALAAFMSCGREWTVKDKSEFVSGCLSKAVIDVGQEKAKTYCHCLLEKVVAKYPNAKDAKYIRYDTSVRQLARACLQ